MSQTAITLAFEQWKALQGATGEPVLLDEFVFANVPGLNPEQPVDRSETLPPAAQIVHRQAVSRKGVVNENAVVHSVVLGADVGDFSFNWIGLINKASGTLAMIVHAPSQQKLKTKEGQQGNVLTRSFLMEYNGAQTETGINTPAETWQIDFTARMARMDERQRLENMDIYGAAAFFGNGYLVAKTGNQFFVTKGTGYVAGLRASLAANQNITVTTKPVKVWLDVCWTGTLTSVWNVQSKITVAANLADYVQNGVQHYVFAVASIDVDGNITDLRPKGSLGEQQASSDFLRKDANLADVNDKAKARKSLELGELAVLSRSDVLPVGVPLPWSTDIPPAGWAIMQGQFLIRLHILYWLSRIRRVLFLTCAAGQSKGNQTAAKFCPMKMMAINPTYTQPVHPVPIWGRNQHPRLITVLKRRVRLTMARKRQIQRGRIRTLSGLPLVCSLAVRIMVYPDRIRARLLQVRRETMRTP